MGNTRTERREGLKLVRTIAKDVVKDKEKQTVALRGNLKRIPLRKRILIALVIAVKILFKRF